MMREDERPDFLDYLPSEREDSTSECASCWTESNPISRNVDRQLSRSIGITLSLCLSPRLKFTMKRSAFLILPRIRADVLDIRPSRRCFAIQRGRFRGIRIQVKGLDRRFSRIDSSPSRVHSVWTRILCVGHVRCF